MNEWLNQLSRLEWLWFSSAFLVALAFAVYGVGVSIDNRRTKAWEREMDDMRDESGS